MHNFHCFILRFETYLGWSQQLFEHAAAYFFLDSNILLLSKT